MFDLLPALMPILLIDIVNPMLFALLVFAAGSGKPVANSVAMLAGHTVAYFLAGIIVSFGIEQISARLAEPHRIDFILSGIVGLGLVLAVGAHALPQERDRVEAEDVGPLIGPKEDDVEHLLAHLVCPGRHTVSGLITTFGNQFRDWTADYSLYSRDRVDADAIFGQVRAEV